MAKEDPEILKKIGRNDGMTVPDGYFDTFAKQMAEALPVRPELEFPSKVQALPRTLWQRVRPYVYLAAMFAGVWCMLKMFSTMSGSQHFPFDNNPVLAEAVTNDVFVNDYIYDDLDQWDIYNDLMEDGFDLDSVDLDLWDDDAADTDLDASLPQSTDTELQ